MQFDDRLKTVLTQPVADIHDRTVRWRQLVDLLSRMPDDEDDGLIEAAFAVVRREREQISDGARAATARAIAGRRLDARLVSIFAQDKLAIAAPLLVASSLDEAGWRMVEANASEDVATLLKSLGRQDGQIMSSLAGKLGDMGVADGIVDARNDVAADDVIFRDKIEDIDVEPEVPPSIGEMVARIERLRGKREPDEVEPSAPGPAVAAPTQTAGGPPSKPDVVAPGRENVRAADMQAASQEWPIESRRTGEAALFRWECDATGQIGWVDGAPRGPLIGRSLADEGEGDRKLQKALHDRTPFDGATLTLAEPMVRGEWRLSGIPAFSPRDGRFLGYRGIARKDAEVVVPEPRTEASRTRVNRDLDALRETIHEIRTPLNAIIGFAEIIDGQYLGPAHRNYRLRAAEIVGQARTLMGAIDDLDYAARLQTDISGELQSIGVTTVMEDIQRDLSQRAAAAGVTLTFSVNSELRIATSSEFAGRLIRRFLSAVVGAGEAGERFDVDVAKGRLQDVRIGISRPMATVGLSEGMLLDPSYVASEGEAAAILGLGFALRMVRGLARMVGGDVQVEQGTLAVFLPKGSA